MSWGIVRSAGILRPPCAGPVCRQAHGMNESTSRAPVVIEVSAVMPCLNEERTIATCIRKAQECMRRMGVAGEVVIADNGSLDRSVEIALSLGARVVHQPVP